MSAVQTKDNLSLTQEDIDYILNQSVPEPQIMNQIQSAAAMGVCQGSSYLSVYWLGVLHGMSKNV